MITVKVQSYGPDRNLVLYYRDPISGKRIVKSAGTKDPREAERRAALLEKELNAGGWVEPSKMTWEAFIERYDREKLAGLSRGTAVQARNTLHQFQELTGIQRLIQADSRTISRFTTRLRDRGVAEATIAKHLRHLKAALRWANKLGLLPTLPHFEMPKRVGTRQMKGRPITEEEFERMLAAVPKVRPRDAEQWQRLLIGLWLSGLRIGEALRLSWDESAPFRVDLSGRYPALRIQAEAQKGYRSEVVPIAPDFGQWLLQTPPEKRRGRVFPIRNTNGESMCEWAVIKVIARIGRAAGVVTDVTTGATATAHDLRRSFGTRWAKRVMPAVLQRLMRHANIATTMAYYVGLTADEVAEGLWRDGAYNTAYNSDRAGRAANDLPPFVSDDYSST